MNGEISKKMKTISIFRYYNLKGVPVFIVFKNGKQTWRGTGLMEEHALREVINNAIDS